MSDLKFPAQVEYDDETQVFTASYACAEKACTFSYSVEFRLGDVQDVAVRYVAQVRGHLRAAHGIACLRTRKKSIPVFALRKVAS